MSEPTFLFEEIPKQQREFPEGFLRARLGQLNERWNRYHRMQHSPSAGDIPERVEYKGSTMIPVYRRFWEDVLEKGLYGLCLRCEKEIPLERLKEVPAARNCISCAEDEERERSHVCRAG